jgi:integrase
MPNPDWLGKLTKKDESLRAHHGLYAAADGWYKTIDGRKRYIAKPMPLADVVAMLDARVSEIRGDVKDKPTKRLGTASTTIEQLAEVFISHLWQRHESGSPKKLARRTYDDYVDTIDRFLDCVGPTQLAIHAGPSWFSKFARTIAHKAVTSRRRDIIYLEAFFNWAGPGRRRFNFYKETVQFGPDLVKPSDRQVQEAMEDYSTVYTPEQYFAALMAVRECPMLLAAGLLAFNCAFLGSDLTEVVESKIFLDAGVHTFPRGKTGIKRKCTLMPETIRAIQRYIEVRPRRPEGCDHLFVRDDGRPFNQRKEAGPGVRGNHNNSIGVYWRHITGLPIKGLRTTFATLADGVPDTAAVDLIMGHAAKTIRQKHYVKSFDESRLTAVVERVWTLFVAGIPLPSDSPVSAFELDRRATAQREPSAKPPKRRAG